MSHWIQYGRCNWSVGRTPLFIMLIALCPGAVRGTEIATWSFPDQGATSQAVLSTTNVSPYATIGAIQVGTGYTQLVQIVNGTNYTYVDSAQNGGWACGVSGTPVNTPDIFFMVGDWNDGVTGGNILASNTSFTVDPTGGGPAGAGCLYVSTPPKAMNDIGEAVSNKLGITFTVEAVLGDWVVTNFSFYSTRDNAEWDRSWVQWHLQVDMGSGFTNVFSSTNNVIPTSESWGLQSATQLVVAIPRKKTVTFRLVGTSPGGADYGREVALDDLRLQGVFTLARPKGTILQIR